MDKVKQELQAVKKEKIDILLSIHEAVYDRNMSESGRLTTIISRFATLLVRLSDDTDKLQIRIYWLTIVFGIIGAFNVIFTIWLAIRN